MKTAGQPALVMLHGWAMNSGVWADLPARLSAVRSVTPIELPGHGAVPLAPGAADLDTWACTCLALAPVRAVWLGWSLGGLVALAAALRAPHRVAGLVLMTATPRFLRAPDWPAAMAGETLAWFRAGLLAEPTVTLERFLALQVRGGDAARETLRALRRELADRAAPDPRALTLGLDLLRSGDLRARLTDLACPSLWLFGSHDTLVPAAAAPAVAALAPRARVGVIQGAAHAPFLSHPQQTLDLIEDFLAGLAVEERAEARSEVPA